MFVTVDVKLIPPLSFLLKVKLGGVLFNLPRTEGAKILKLFLTGRGKNLKMNGTSCKETKETQARIENRTLY